MAAEQPQRWRRELHAQRIEEVVAVLSAFRPGLFDEGGVYEDLLTAG